LRCAEPSDANAAANPSNFERAQHCAMNATASKGHRQDIQQLRGIAVLAVIINHLGATWLPGGYLGVDMFFVVSGFVITLSMLSGNSASTSRLRFFAQFWVRRTFRLWPTLFVTVIVSTAVLVVTGLANPEPLLTGLASVLALSNFRLLVGRLEYFAIDTGADWFMHTWSLAVEEQIYVLISVVFAIFGFRRSASALESRVRMLFFVVLALALLSVTFAFLPLTSEVVRFYAPHTRFYQVGIGALVALWFAQSGRSTIALPKMARTSLLSVCGGGLLALFIINPWSGRTISLVTTLLTAMVIASASQRHHTSGFAPGNWLGGIGDRSYSLYLVHWPVQVLAATLIEAEFPRYASSIVLTFLLGFAGYHFVEDRTRHRWKSLRVRRAAVLAVATLLATLSVTALGYLRTDHIARSAVVEIPPERCTRENAPLWVVGDSHFTHAPLEPVLAREVDSDCWNIGGYGIVMEVVWLDRESAGQREVRMRLTPTAWLIEQIRTATAPPRALMVVHFLSAFLADPSTAPASANFVATEWQSTTGEMVTREEFIRLFAENLRQLAAVMGERGGELVVTSPPPDFDWLVTDIDPALCSNRLVVSRDCALYRSEARISLDKHEARSGDVHALLDDMQRELPNFTHIRLDTPFCGSEYCSNFERGKPVYLDDDHLNLAGVELVKENFEKVVSRLHSSGVRSLRCLTGRSVYECRLVEPGGLMGEYILPARFASTEPRAGLLQELTHTDDNGSVLCISLWQTEELTFVGGRCASGR